MKYPLLALLLATGCRTGTTPPPTRPEVETSEAFLTCWNGGPVLYKETMPRLSWHEDMEVLTIHESGAWRLEGSHREQYGCLSADDLAALRDKLANEPGAAVATAHAVTWQGS